MTIELDGAAVTVLNRAGLEAFLGVIDTGRERGLLGRAMAFKVGDLVALTELLQ
jgi:hypothetical protein